eukprot:9245087-Pyramimonas_sp.AAC.1
MQRQQHRRGQHCDAVRPQPWQPKGPLTDILTTCGFLRTAVCKAVRDSISIRRSRGDRNVKA